MGDAPHEHCSRILCRPQVRHSFEISHQQLTRRPLCSTKTTTWDDPRLPSSLDQNVPQYKRDFRRKLIYFRSQPALRPSPGQCHVKVRRTHIFEDSYAEIMRQSPNDLKKRLMIKFEGEDGLDYGGLSREFFFLLSHEMFNPFYCLFEYSAVSRFPPSLGCRAALKHACPARSTTTTRSRSTPTRRSTRST